MALFTPQEALDYHSEVRPGKIEVVPVKSTIPVEMELFVPISKVLARIYVGKPVRRGDLICNNVLNLGIDIVATKTVE